ncbi:MAG: aminotransferase class III-fold pyridoxal phosphate-dependent enzyme, partial [Candidatus Omnitrophica bacterium]|nr:aminotransferase class III-fold pyridoxal phosphate-dependent enzyme [Candidatus Omnitrophota bacterium]
PDLTCLGKIIGGGLPLAAYGGRTEIMDCVSPLGRVYQAGTLSGNPVAVSAGIAALKVLARKDYMWLNQTIADFCQSLQSLIRTSGIACTVNHAGSLFTLFFTDRGVTDYASAKRSDVRRYARFFRKMLGAGIYCAPSQFEANFFSFAHSRKDRERTLAAMAGVLKGR